MTPPQLNTPNCTVQYWRYKSIELIKNSSHLGLLNSVVVSEIERLPRDIGTRFDCTSIKVHPGIV